VGEAACLLDARQLLDATQALQELERHGAGATLFDAVTFYIERSKKPGTRITVAQLYTSLMESMESRRLAPRSIQTARMRLRGFLVEFGKRSVSEVTKADVEQWLSRYREYSSVTQNALRTYASLLFNHAIRQEYIETSPVAKIDRVKVEYSLPEILTPEEVRRLLDVARRECPETVVKLAVGFFAGLRSCELSHLRWEHINIEDRVISVLHSKTSSGTHNNIPRHVHVQDNLAAWLTAFRQDSGPVGPGDKAFNAQRNALLAPAGVERWPSNAMRHSFGTYNLCAFGSADRTAVEMGHMQGIRVLFRHYRGLATNRQAEEYWGIVPRAVDAEAGRKP